MELDNKPESVVFSPKLSPADVTRIITDSGRISPQVTAIKDAVRYYGGHSDIENKKRVYYTKEKVAIDNPAANNSRLKSRFLRQLVQQKQDHSLAKSFILKLSTENEKEVDLAKDDYGKAWKQFCDKTLNEASYDLCGLAVNDGIGWCYVWIDGNGDFQLKTVPSELIYPVWRDSQHKDLDRLVYNFIRLKYEGLSPEKTEYAEYWTGTERHLFNVSTGYKEEAVLTDKAGGLLVSHMTDNVSWGKIPFIAFKGTQDEATLLSFIREQVDDYEKVFSRGVDGVIDDLDPLLLVKEMSSDIEVIKETKELMRLTRLVSVSPDGDARYISADTNIEKHLLTIERLRKDIYKFGYGVDTQDARFGGNPNQLEIQALYQDLDTYTDGLERQFQNFITDLKYFFDRWWELTGRGSFVIAQSYKALVQFDRSMLMNQSAQIEDTVKLSNTGISQKTILEFNPVVQDVEQELERLEEEQKERERDNPFAGLPERPEGKEPENDDEPEENTEKTVKQTEKQ